MRCVDTSFSLALCSDSLAIHRFQLAVVLAVAEVFAVYGAEFIFSDRGSLIAVGVGWLLLAMVDVSAQDVRIIASLSNNNLLAHLAVVSDIRRGLLVLSIAQCWWEWRVVELLQKRSPKRVRCGLQRRGDWYRQPRCGCQRHISKRKEPVELYNGRTQRICSCCYQHHPTEGGTQYWLQPAKSIWGR